MLIAVPIIGAHIVRSEMQKREEWSGTVVRVYAERGALSRRSSTPYWDVRTTTGEIRSPAISPRSEWKKARVGDHVVKHAGNYNPTIVGH